jgi:hypothetical protein
LSLLDYLDIVSLSFTVTAKLSKNWTAVLYVIENSRSKIHAYMHKYSPWGSQCMN